MDHPADSIIGVISLSKTFHSYYSHGHPWDRLPRCPHTIELRAWMKSSEQRCNKHGRLCHQVSRKQKKHIIEPSYTRTSWLTAGLYRVKAGTVYAVVIATGKQITWPTRTEVPEFAGDFHGACPTSTPTVFPPRAHLNAVLICLNNWN